MKTLLFFFIFLFSLSSSYAIGPFPIKGEIKNSSDVIIGTAHVYPRYVEIFDMQNQKKGKVGILVEQGLAKLFLVQENKTPILVGYASGGKVYNSKNETIGRYIYTPTYSFVYNLEGKPTGNVKCIAWPRVCSAGVAAYLLALF